MFKRLLRFIVDERWPIVLGLVFVLSLIPICWILRASFDMPHESVDTLAVVIVSVGYCITAYFFRVPMGIVDRKNRKR